MKLYLIEIWILIIMELIGSNQVMKIGIIRYSKLFLIDSVVPLILSCSESVIESYPCADL